MRIIILFCYLCIQITSAQDNNNERKEIYICFNERFDFENGNTKQNLKEIEAIGFEKILKGIRWHFQKETLLSEEKLHYLEEQALKLGNDPKYVQRLRNTFRVSFYGITDKEYHTIIQQLNDLKDVVYSEMISDEPVPPPYDIPPATPDYFSAQTYIQSSIGVNTQYAWDLGLNGSGIRLRDVEYGVNVEHEDLNEVNVFIADGMTVSNDASVSYTEHGTAAMSVVMANKGTYGISGMAYGVSEGILYPEWTTQGYNRNYAVSQAINNSVAGDVIMYEMQTGGYNSTQQNPNYVPAEYSSSIWNLTKAATNAGIVIVAAAGNGNQNLDAPEYVSYMNRGDSGAIIVGAGSPNAGHNRLSFSTYGSRVDVHGWGQGVRACGYGDYSKIGNDFNQNYTNFSGTSSATPIVASCVIVLQSYYHQQTGNYLTGVELREILQATGTPQGSGGNIGPLPNMEQAILYLDEQYLATDTFNTEKYISVYPNPADTFVRIKAPAFGNVLSVEIYNSLGQAVFKKDMENNGTLSVSHLEQGIYFAKITGGNKQTTQKIIIR